LTDSDAAATQAHHLAASGNKLLAITSSVDLNFLIACGNRRSFDRGKPLSHADQPASIAYFIEQGIASVVKAEGDRRAEICLIGQEGFTGSAIAQADGRWPYETFVQSDHLVAFGVGASDLRDLMERSTAFRGTLLNAAHVQTVQIAENLVSAAWQRTSVRLARWLLMFYDRMGSHHLDVTHEFMAMMIGSQRPKVTEALHDLEAAGAISASRGRIVIRDTVILKQLADGTYGCAEQEADRLYSAERRC
jgi:CRP-like cAMP-binding protein